MANIYLGWNQLVIGICLPLSAVLVVFAPSFSVDSPPGCCSSSPASTACSFVWALPSTLSTVGPALFSGKINSSTSRLDEPLLFGGGQIKKSEPFFFGFHPAILLYWVDSPLYMNVFFGRRL